MDLIVAVSENWAIGRDGNLLFSLPTDMKYFRKMTAGRTLILGRRNLDSFPGGRPLPKRTNLVLTRDPDFRREGAVICHSAEEILSEAAARPEDAMVIGGEEIYRMFLPRCRHAYVTRVEKAVPEADRHFPNLEELPGWEAVSVSEEFEESGIRFRFWTYVNQNL